MTKSQSNKNSLDHLLQEIITEVDYVIPIQVGKRTFQTNCDSVFKVLVF